MKNKKYISFMIILLFSMLVTNAVSASSTIPIENLAVVLDQRDNAINSALETLKNELTTINIVTINSIHYHLSLLRPIDNVIIVGHGNNEGMIIQGELVSWTYADELTNKFRSNQVHFLICESNNIKEFSNNPNIGMTISGVADATSSALAVSVIIDVMSGRFQEAVDRSVQLFLRDMDISEGKISPEYLNFGIYEMIGHAAMGLFYTALLLVNVYIPSSTWTAFATNMYHKVKITLELIHVAILAYKAVDTANYLLHILKEADNHDLRGFLYQHLAWYDYVAAIALIVVLVTIAFFTAGASEVARVGAYLASMAFWGVALYKDINDCDDVFMSSPGGFDCSPPPPPPPPPPCGSPPCIN
jgi:hypothetical protein